MNAVESISVLYQGAVTILLLLLSKKRKLAAQQKKVKRKLWARQWLLKRTRGRGVANMVFHELKYEDPKSFKHFTRMSVAIFNKLLMKVEPLLRKQDTVLRESISAKQRLLLTLRFLATGENFRSLQYYFRISVSSISNIVAETIKVVYEVLKEEYLHAPCTQQEWIHVADKFHQMWNFPNCLGALDGKHIAFRASKADGSFYFNYKGFNSIVLMALVDAEYNFIYVDVGCNGRVSDGGVYLNSSLYTAVEKKYLHFPEDTLLPNSERQVPYVIIADDAFRLTTRMMKPFGQRSSKEQRIFNYRLSRARRVVENAFGILANKFQILQREIHLPVEKVQDVTLACCVLHNFIRKCEGTSYLTGLDVENTDMIMMTPGTWRKEVYTTRLQPMKNIRSPNDALSLRNCFTDYFNNEGFVPWQWEAIKKFNF